MERLVIVILKASHKDMVEHEEITACVLIVAEQNHTIETCFLKHGYPPGYKGKGKASTANSQIQSVASVNAGSKSSQQSSNTSSFGFTQEQYNNILELIQHSKTIPKANSISTSPFVLNSHSPNDNEPFQGNEWYS